jgi:hypothetical protein
MILLRMLSDILYNLPDLLTSDHYILVKIITY